MIMMLAMTGWYDMHVNQLIKYSHYFQLVKYDDPVLP